jgi:TPP-dependent pyruvate/acetoin dehydrogenase alpha subunit
MPTLSASTAWTWWRCTRRRAKRAAHVRDGGPFFLEFRTYRFRAHSMFDPELYRDKAEVEAWKQRGPIHTFTARLKASGTADEDEFLALDAKANGRSGCRGRFAEAGSLGTGGGSGRRSYAAGCSP